MSIRKTFSFVLSVLSVGSLVLTACGGAETGSQTTGGKETITFWADQEAPENVQKQIWQPVLDQFEKETGIHVNYQLVPWTNLMNQIQNQISSGASDVDVVGIGNTWASGLAATGGFLPLTPDRLEKIGGKGKFLDAAFALTGLPGKDPIAVPYLSEAMGVFYNKDMFREAGITETPKTWDEFITVARKLTKPEKNQYGLVLDAANGTDLAHLFFVLLQQKGGTFFKDQDGKQPNLTDAKAKEAAQFLGDWFVQGIVSPRSAEYNSADQMEQAFIRGEGAMMIDQNLAMTVLDGSSLKDKYGVFPLPVFPGGEKVTSHVAGIDLAIFKNSKHQEAALKFLKFVTDKEAQVALNKGFHLFPPTKAAIQDPFFSSNENLQVFRKVLEESAKPTPRVATYTQVETDIGTAMKNILAAAATKNGYSPDFIVSELSKANNDIAAIAGAQ